MMTATPSFQLGISYKDTLFETEDVHSKRHLSEGEEISPAHKFQRTGLENGRVFKKRERKASSFRFSHGPPEMVNFSTHPNSAFQLVDPTVFLEPPPGFESFKKYTRPTRRINLAKGKEKVSTALSQQTKMKEQENSPQGERLVALCHGMKGETTLTIEEGSGRKHYKFEAYKKDGKAVGKSTLASIAEGEVKKQTIKEDQGRKGKKKANMKKKRPIVMLGTKLLKTNYEKALMKAMLHITAKKQKKQNAKIHKLDFILSPTIQLPYQLYSKEKHGDDTDPNKEHTSQSNSTALLHYQSTSNISEFAVSNPQSKPPTNPFPSPSSKPPPHPTLQNPATLP